MRASEVRASVLSDHEKLRALLAQLEQRAQAVVAGGHVKPATLRAEATALLESLATHMSWEDRYLAPVLREVDAWGEERTARLAADHREQRELLRYELRELHDESRPDAVVARNLLDLVALLRTDMDEEEEGLLDPRVLRDDIVGIDVSTG